MTILNTNQTAYLTRAIKDGKGLIEIGEFAQGLGKQKGNVIRKLEKSFSTEQLFKMKACKIVTVNNNASQAISTYMLDHKTAAALAMSYDLQLGIQVLTLLEEALQTITAITIEAAKDNSAGVLKEATRFFESYQARFEYRVGASEKEDRSTALRRLGRKGLDKMTNF